MSKEYNNYNKPELKVLFWNVLADVYLKYYDTKVKELSPTYDLDFKLRPLEANYSYRQERIMKYIRKMSPDIIGLVEIQDTMYDYLKEKLDEYYNFTEIISDELDQDKIDYNFPLEGKCIIYKKSLEITNMNVHALDGSTNGKSVTYLSAFHGKMDVVKYLLEKGGNLNDKKEGIVDGLGDHYGVDFRGESVALSGRNRTDGDASAIGDLLKTNNTLKKLYLGLNNITDVQSIGEGLKTNLNAIQQYKKDGSNGYQQVEEMKIRDKKNYF